MKLNQRKYHPKAPIDTTCLESASMFKLLPKLGLFVIKITLIVITLQINGEINDTTLKQFYHKSDQNEQLCLSNVIN